MTIEDTNWLREETQKVIKETESWPEWRKKAIDNHIPYGYEDKDDCQRQENEAPKRFRAISC